VSPIARPVGGWGAWVRAARPRQWAKNVLVFGAPAAAGVLTQPAVLARVCVAFVAFCLLSSGAYLINDVADAAEDRRHPVKRHRPIASGAIAEWPALAAGVGVVMLGIALSRTVGWGLVGVACGYAMLNAAYTGVLRAVAVADIASIAGAFVLRALAGGVAADVHVSRWFVVVVSSVALFVAAGKRYADLLDPAAHRSRRVLKRYSVEFLRSVIAGAGAVALVAYCVWAFETVHPGLVPWRELTIVPFVLAILRYRVLVTRGRGGAPEQILFSDVFVQVTGAAWLMLFCIGA
jgi:decaprenyl-phosphate phosphoribosyltransferase